MALLIVPLAAALAAATYFLAGRPAPGLWPAVAGRATAWGALALLLVNLSCPAAARDRAPLVLLDLSPSLDAAGGRAAEARALADSLGEVRPFTGSRLAPALVAAAASGRRVIVVSDGEIADAAELPADLLAAATVRVLPRAEVPDLAVVRVEGPRRGAVGDSLRIRVEVRAYGLPDRRAVPVEVRGAGRVLLRGEVALDPQGMGQTTLEGVLAGVPPGDHLLEVVIPDAGDAEPRTDRRLHLLTITPTPGVVLVANPGGWESRFLFRTLRDVAALPVQGYLMLEPGTWRRMSDLVVVGGATVQEAVRGADLLVTMGAPPDGAARSRARGRWEWPDAAPIAGDWYLRAADLSPVAGAFTAIPPDSLPPATALLPIEPAAGGWVGLQAQLGRRGAERAAVIGSEAGGRRTVTVGVSGLWRWAFRGGVAEQAYRAWVAGTTTWLLGRADSATGLAAPVRAVVERGEPHLFRWTGDSAAAPLPITLTGAETTRIDTLAFDGEGRARLDLEPGAWRYTLAGGGAGVVAVEEFSREFLPQTRTLPAREAATAPAGSSRSTRDFLWLFGLAALAWCVEWGARRRVGMR